MYNKKAKYNREPTARRESKDPTSINSTGRKRENNVLHGCYESLEGGIQTVLMCKQQLTHRCKGTHIMADQEGNGCDK